MIWKPVNYLLKRRNCFHFSLTPPVSKSLRGPRTIIFYCYSQRNLEQDFPFLCYYDAGANIYDHSIQIHRMKTMLPSYSQHLLVYCLVLTVYYSKGIFVRANTGNDCQRRCSSLCNFYQFLIRTKGLLVPASQQTQLSRNGNRKLKTGPCLRHALIKK